MACGAVVQAQRADIGSDTCGITSPLVWLGSNPDQALALPSLNGHKLLNSMPNGEYSKLRWFVASVEPGKDVVLVAPGELVFNAKWTPCHFKNLKVWLVGRAA